MEKKYKILKILIFSLAIMIIIGLIIVYKISGQNPLKPNKNEVTISEDEGIYDYDSSYKPNVEFKQVKEARTYFTVEKIVKTLVTDIQQINGIIGKQTYDDIEVTRQGIEMLTSVLDKQYTQEYSVSNEKILEKYYHVYTNYHLDIEKIYSSEASNIILYYLVYAKLDNKDFNLLIKTDSKNSTYSVFLPDYVEDKKISYDMAESEINLDYDYIEKKDGNIFTYRNISDQYMIDTYLKKYKETMFSDSRKAYEQLDEEYRKLRFDTFEKFEKYINSNREMLESIEIASYLKNTYTDYTQYVGKDQYNNVYIFDSPYVMSYKVQLDDYTVPDEELDEEYMKLSTQEKVANNVNKWIKMINSRDYQAAFNVLDETFRSDNFNNNVEMFEEYMTEKFPNFYDFKLGKYSDETGISMLEIIMSDITGKEVSEVGETIYMQLGEGTDFIMSFNVI